ncbi:hypothetical protein Bca52824_093147 [Brassica carinata]|uniref:Uncharacterized protein n=1 Tax=Brassica carinata TaxID=52824 RepID=A0A8X7P6H7_BRACI|nr:hypothetical protein Bca52824_093147 [Brassica carinata]
MRSSLRVGITKRERRLFKRKRDEVESFIEKTVANLSKEDKKQEISAWINKNLQGKEKKKQETIEFGDILGSSKFDLMLFMLTAIGVKLPEGMELTKEVKNQAPARRDPMEKKKEEETAFKEYYEAQKLKDDEEAEKFYEEEEARLNAESASKHPVEERKAEHTKSEDYEDLADDAEKLKEDEEEARLLIAAVV